MIGQATSLEAGVPQKIGPGVSNSRQKTLGADEFAKILGQERGAQHESSEDAAPTSTTAQISQELNDTVVEQLEQKGNDAHHSVDVLLASYFIDMPIDGRNISSGEHVLPALESSHKPGLRNRPGTASDPLSFNATLHHQDQDLVPVQGQSTPGQSNHEAGLSVSGDMYDAKPPSASVAAEDTQTAIELQEIDFTRYPLPPRPVDSDGQKDDFKAVTSRLEDCATSDRPVPGQSAAPAPSPQPFATATPARQILLQLQTPLVAAVREAADPGKSSPLRHLKITLRPDDLGTVNLTLRMQNGNLSIVIETSAPGTAELLQKDRGLLEDMLKPVVADGPAATITILTAESGNAMDSNDAIGNGSASGSGESGAGRRQSSTGKEAASTQEQERTPAHEEPYVVRRSQPGILVL